MLAYTYIHKNFFWDKCCQYVFFSINHYYAENQGLKRTENKRSVQFKFTKKLNFRSFQSSFGKSELSSVQSSPKNELLNWTELFRSVRPIHYLSTQQLMEGTRSNKWYPKPNKNFDALQKADIKIKKESTFNEHPYKFWVPIKKSFTRTLLKKQKKEGGS